MPFVKMEGLRGMIYVPEPKPGDPKKHPCPDCFSCQMCADSRCSVCLRQKGHKTSCTCEEKQPEKHS